MTLKPKINIQLDSEAPAIVTEGIAGILVSLQSIIYKTIDAVEASNGKESVDIDIKQDIQYLVDLYRVCFLSGSKVVLNDLKNEYGEDCHPDHPFFKLLNEMHFTAKMMIQDLCKSNMEKLQEEMEREYISELRKVIENYDKKKQA